MKPLVESLDFYEILHDMATWITKKTSAPNIGMIYSASRLAEPLG
jgi:hypothetical protein